MNPSLPQFLPLDTAQDQPLSPEVVANLDALATKRKASLAERVANYPMQDIEEKNRPDKSQVTVILMGADCFLLANETAAALFEAGIIPLPEGFSPAQLGAGARYIPLAGKALTDLFQSVEFDCARIPQALYNALVVTPAGTQTGAIE